MFILGGCAWQVDTSGRRDSKPKASRVTNPNPPLMSLFIWFLRNLGWLSGQWVFVRSMGQVETKSKQGH